VPRRTLSALPPTPLPTLKGPVVGAWPLPATLLVRGAHGEQAGGTGFGPPPLPSKRPILCRGRGVDRSASTATSCGDRRRRLRARHGREEGTGGGCDAEWLVQPSAAPQAGAQKEERAADAILGGRGLQGARRRDEDTRCLHPGGCYRRHPPGCDRREAILGGLPVTGMRAGEFNPRPRPPRRGLAPHPFGSEGFRAGIQRRTV